MDDPTHGTMSADEFLVWVERQDGRFELVDGIPRPGMTGAPQSHNVAASNILVALSPQTRRNGCRATVSKTAVRTGPNAIRYPDVVIDCGRFDSSAREATGPVLVVEVSSPRTSSIDITEKLDEYRAYAGLRVILLVTPDVVAVKAYRRDAAGAWHVERYDGLEQSVDLPEIGGLLSLTDIYDTLSPKQRPTLRVV